MKFIVVTTLLFSYAFANISLPKNFSTKFRQTVTNTKKKQIKYRGSLSFVSPNKFKWSYKAPTKKEVCTDGRTLLVVDHDLEQVSKYILKRGLNISKIVSRAKIYKQNIYLAKYENKNYTIVVDSKKRLKSIGYLDDLDNTVNIFFDNMSYNKKRISKKMMRCKYPKNYDYIRG
jgi:outer membrane lipoprotein carrier protein